jgi:ferredoxin
VDAAVRISVDKARCAGHGRCSIVDEALFPLDDDGYTAIDTIEVPAGKEVLARRGVGACPERALSVIDP